MASVWGRFHHRRVLGHGGRNIGRRRLDRGWFSRVCFSCRDDVLARSDTRPISHMNRQTDCGTSDATRGDASRLSSLASPNNLLYSISMRILIATGIFEPEVGGPATYAPRLARHFAAAGNSVAVITYSATLSKDSDKNYPFKLVRIVRGNRLLNRVRFFFAAYREAKKCDLIYTLDWFAAGLPVALAAKLLGKPYVVRVGGDHPWEHNYL